MRRWQFYFFRNFLLTFCSLSNKIPIKMIAHHLKRNNVKKKKKKKKKHKKNTHTHTHKKKTKKKKKKKKKKRSVNPRNHTGIFVACHALFFPTTSKQTKVGRFASSTYLRGGKKSFCNSSMSFSLFYKQ